MDIVLIVLRNVVVNYKLKIINLKASCCNVRCNEEGKLVGLPFNRALRDEEGRVYDIVVGTFFLCRALAEGEDFDGLTEG